MSGSVVAKLSELLLCMFGSNLLRYESGSVEFEWSEQREGKHVLSICAEHDGSDRV